MTRLGTTLMASLLAAGAIALDLPALADGNEGGQDARALALFNEGRAALQTGDYAVACAKFADSKTLDPGAGTLLNLAYCYEKLGREAEAWGEYRAAALVAHEHGRPEWENAARARAARLEPALVWVVVHLERQSDQPLLDIRLDGAPMAIAFLERPAAVDPGPHEVRVSAAGRRPWSTRFEADGEHVSTVVIPSLESLETPTADHARGPEKPYGPATGEPNVRQTAAIAVGAVGIGALGTASVLGLVALSTYNGADCVGTTCTPGGRNTQSRAFTEANLATASAVAGAAALGGAAALWLSGPSASAAKGAARVRPDVSETSWGLSLAGRW